MFELCGVSSSFTTQERGSVVYRVTSTFEEEDEKEEEEEEEGATLTTLDKLQSKEFIDG